MRHALTAVLAALAVSLSLPAAAEPDEPSENPGESTDAPYRCTDDVPEADFGLVDMACEEPEPMSTAALQMSCTQCWSLCHGYGACFNCCCFGQC